MRDRERDAEGRPALGVAFSPKATPVGSDDRPADREPESHPAWLGREERFEPPILQTLRDPDPTPRSRTKRRTAPSSPRSVLTTSLTPRTVHCIHRVATIGDEV